MTRLRLPDVEAFELLKQASQRRNVKLRELAEDVIYTGSV
jgi:AmiR/NasT family two-component response regulator